MGSCGRKVGSVVTLHQQTGLQEDGQELSHEFDNDRMAFLPAGAAICAFSLWYLHGVLLSRAGEGGSCFCRIR
jgi:hypothetical protein